MDPKIKARLRNEIQVVRNTFTEDKNYAAFRNLKPINLQHREVKPENSECESVIGIDYVDDDVQYADLECMKCHKTLHFTYKDLDISS